MKQLLARPAVVVVAALLAFALTLPSITNGLAIDDHLYRARVVDDEWSAGRSARDLFVFANPDHASPSPAADERTQQIESGELSWWAAPKLRWGFMRPLPALIHHAEWRALGRSDGGTMWMHLHSVLWMAALSAVVALLYRRLIGGLSGSTGATWIAGLAAVLYAIDDAHGFAVGWLANRCGIQGAVFAVLALLAHDRWRRRARKAASASGATSATPTNGTTTADGATRASGVTRVGTFAFVAPLLFLLSLLCSEQMVAAAGFLFAYALCLDDRRGRFAALAPYALITVAWFVARSVLGYGSVGTGSYTDPFHEPATYALHVLERVPILVHSQLGALPADLWEVLFVRQGLTWVMVLAGVVYAALFALGVAKLVRADRVAKFWVVGGLLALGVVCGAHPNDRHLLLVGIAGSGLVAQFCGAWLDRERAVLPRLAPVLGVFLVFVHAIAAPILLPVRARIPGSVARGVERIDQLVPGDAALAQQDLVLVNVPFKYLCNFASVVRRSNGGVSPRRWRCLGVSPDDVVVARVDDRTISLTPTTATSAANATGTHVGYLRFFEDTNVRARGIPFATGDRVDVPGLAITIREVTGDGRPATIEAHFDVPLEDASLRWLVWRDGAYRPFVPPAIGESATIPAQHYAFGDLLSDDAAKPQAAPAKAASP
ncbi:MAG TPA: hypothetical protein VMZ53_13275 [Kofleriaceae bacterium]|nr:hypothetical protein [Kofleriaceae bacterium]